VNSAIVQPLAIAGWLDEAVECAKSKPPKKRKIQDRSQIYKVDSVSIDDSYEAGSRVTISTPTPLGSTTAK